MWLLRLLLHCPSVGDGRDRAALRLSLLAIRTKAGITNVVPVMTRGLADCYAKMGIRLRSYRLLLLWLVIPAKAGIQ